MRLPRYDLIRSRNSYATPPQYNLKVLSRHRIAGSNNARRNR